MSVFRELYVFGLFWESDLGQFPREMYEFVEKTAWDPDGNCCHGPS